MESTTEGDTLGGFLRLEDFLLPILGNNIYTLTQNFSLLGQDGK